MLIPFLPTTIICVTVLICLAITGLVSWIMGMKPPRK